MSEQQKQICANRKARFDYHILDSFEAGVALLGTEVKSLRSGKGNIKESYARFKGGELWLIGMHISPYEMGNRQNHEPERPRKLLMNSRELRKLRRQVDEKGLTLVPLRMYFNEKGWVKLEVALGRGKAKYDKRQAIAKRDSDRARDRARRRDTE